MSNHPTTTGPATDNAITEPIEHESVLDRRLLGGGLSWWMVWSLIALLGGALFRLANLDAFALSPLEGRYAFQGWAVFQGEGAYGPAGLPETHPLTQLATGFAFFIAGATDVTARLAPAFAGIGMLLLVLLLRPVARPAGTLGLLLTVGLSPSLVYFSRTVDPAIFVAFFTLLWIVAVARAGTTVTATGLMAWSAAAGVAMAGMIASSPIGITAILAGGVAMTVSIVAASNERYPDALGVGSRAILLSPRALLVMTAALAVTLVLLFTRMLSDLGALAGLVETFTEWARILGTRPTTTPVQFFLWGTLLYELVAVALAIVALMASPLARLREGDIILRGSTFVTWFGVALVLQSLSSGREPEQFVLVSLPLVLAAGIGLGRLLARVEEWRLLSSVASLVPFSVLAMLIGLIAIFMAVARGNDPGTSTSASIIEIAIIMLLVILPFSAVLARAVGGPYGGPIVRWSALLVLVAVLGVFGVRNASMLAFERSDEGTELLAQETSTPGVTALVDQVTRLSRDLSVGEATAIDPTGRYNLEIAISPDIADPYRWYFRDFPRVSVTGPAGWSGADVVIAPTSASMAEQGYIVQTRALVNRVPPAYQRPSTGDIGSYIVSPSKWYDGIRYLLFRETVAIPPPEQIAIGYTAAVSNQLNPSLGPFNLQDSPGRGSALGQMDTPIGITVSQDGGTIYVADSNNLRIVRFSASGEFIGVWGAETDPNLAFASAFGVGPTGLATSPDGVVWVADTWNHRVVGIDRDGQMVREIGQRGVQTNIGDSPDPSIDTGRFFGPRGVAIHNSEIYVTDTGNERVQVFASDGTFLRSFGGFGSGPGQLLEPVGIAVGADGTVFVADSGNNRLSIFTNDGEPIDQVPIPSWEDQEQLVNYLATGADGLVYLTAPDNGTVDVFDPASGEIVLTTRGDDGAELRRPMGIAVTATGEVLVTDTAHHDVLRFVPEIPAARGGASPAVASPEAASPAG